MKAYSLPIMLAVLQRAFIASGKTTSYGRGHRLTGFAC